MEGGVALEAVDGVALEGGLVEEEVDDFVCVRGEGTSARSTMPRLLALLLCFTLALESSIPADFHSGDKDGRDWGGTAGGAWGEGRRTVATRGGLVVQVVAHDGRGAVEQGRDLVVGLAVEQLGEEVGIVAAAGSDELLLDGGALWIAPTMRHGQPGFIRLRMRKTQG